MIQAGTLQRRHFSEDEASVESVSGWQLQCLQLTAGVLAGDALDLHLPGVQLLFERYRNVCTGHCGMAPEDAVVFGIAAGMAGVGRFNGQPWRDGITAFDSRQELVSVVPPVDLITLVVDRGRIEAHVRATCHVELDHWLQRALVRINDAALARPLFGHLLAVKTAAVQAGPAGLAEPVQQQMADDLLELLCAQLQRQLHSPPPPRHEGSQVATVRRVRDHVQAHADEPLRIVDLCQALGVSRRWLQTSFHGVMGTAPWDYLHLMRLNGARRLLLQPVPGRRVADAVEAWGFWHHSRFSRDYRRHFGELPSQTLQRARDQAHTRT